MLNKVFKTYGKLCNKNLLSHSCRISFITRICKIAGVETARLMVGHTNISTTQRYNRQVLSSREQKQIINESLTMDDSSIVLESDEMDLIK